MALVVKNLPANTGDIRDVGSIPGSGGSPGVGNGNPNQYSCLENPMDQGTWQTTVHGLAKNWTQLSKWAQMDGWLANLGHPWNQKSALMLAWVISESRSVVSNSLWLHGLYIPWNSPGQNTGVSSLSFLQGIFPTQGSNPGLLNCWQFLY